MKVIEVCFNLPLLESTPIITIMAVVVKKTERSIIDYEMNSQRLFSLIYFRYSEEFKPNFTVAKCD